MSLTEGSGAIDKLTLAGCNGYADCAISFKYELSDYVPAAATLTLTAIKASTSPHHPPSALASS